MKIFGKIIALVFVLFHSACETNDTEIKPPPPSANWKTVSISAYLAPEVRDYGDRTMDFSRSRGTTSNLADKDNLSLSHQAYYFDENENFEIQDGHFNLWTDDPQHTLNGTFTVVASRPTDNSSWKDTSQCSRLPETLPRLLLASP